jgi:hypothetical protein
MENLLNSVIAAERKAFVTNTTSYSVRRRELRVKAERIGVLIEAAGRGKEPHEPGSRPGHGYLFLSGKTTRIEQVVCVYEHDGQYLVLIRDVMHCCETLSEAKACLQNWAAEES